MFKDDKMMTLLTGLVLAIFAGTMVQYGDSIVSLLSGDSTESTEDDYFTALAGAEQKLDVLANDIVRGPLAITAVPACGALRLGNDQTLIYQSDASCVGEQQFTYCVVGAEGCTSHEVTISVVAGTAVANAQPAESTSATTLQTAADAPDASLAASNAAPAAATPQLAEPNSAAGETTNTVANNSAPPVVGNVAPSLASPSDSGPDVDTVVAGIRPPMLAAPQVGEFVAPGDAAAQLRDEVANLSGANGPADANLANVAAATSFGQMDTSFAAPSLGDEGVSLGRSVVVAGTSLGATGGPVVEDSASVAIAAIDEQAVNTAAPQPVITNNAAAAADSVEVLEQGPFVLETVSVLAAAAPVVPQTSGVSGQDGDLPFAGDTVLMATALLPQADVLERGANVTVDQVESFPALAAAEEQSIAIDPTSDTTTMAAVAPAATQTNDAGAQLPPVADTTTSSPTALVSAATTLLPSLDATPERPRMLMRHVAMNTAPETLASDDPALTVPPSIDSSAAPALQTASLQPETTAPAPSLPADTACDIALDTLARPGAEIELIVSAACRPNQMFTVSHAGLSFSAMTGDDGSASVQFPAMENSANIAVVFADGAQERTLAIIGDAQDMLRSGFSWRGDAELLLNAYEFGAMPGGQGHISLDSPRDFRAARILGGGFLTVLGDVDAPDAAHALIYSMPVSRATPEGVITLSLQIGNPGSGCGGLTEITTFRSENAAASSRLQNLELGACNAAMPSGEFVGLLDDLWTAAR